MRYEGPIYRPPSEAGSLLIQATIGCPHNRCTFCMVYKNGPPFKIRPLPDIEQDMLAARDLYGGVRSLFFPAGNTIAMPTADLARICRFARKTFSQLEHITVYGSSQYIHRKGPAALALLQEAGLARIHVGLESGDDVTLSRIRKGSNSGCQIEAGRQVVAAGIELSLYVMLGIAGRERSAEHAARTAAALNRIKPQFIRLRTFVPKINTPLLEEVRTGSFQMLGPHEVLTETAALLGGLKAATRLFSDHYTNYIDLQGRLPEDKPEMLARIAEALKRDEDSFRPFFIGTQ